MKTKVYDCCGSEISFLPMLWRAAFISEICGIKIPDDMEIRRLSPKTVGNIQCEIYSEALAHLLVLFGAGYVSEETVEALAGDAEKCGEAIFRTEELVVSQSEKAEEERISEELVQNILLCAASSKRYSEIKGTSFENVRKLCGNSYTAVRGGFVFVKNKSFLTLLLESGEKMGYMDGGKIRVLDKEEIINGFSDTENLSDMIDGSDGEIPDMPFLLDLNNAACIMEIYGKPYSTEFIYYAKEEKIPFDEFFSENFRKYVAENKLRFVITAITRKRLVCGNEINWFDYCTAKYTGGKLELSESFDTSDEIDLGKTLGENDELTDSELTKKAVSQFLRKVALNEKTVLEVTHCGEKLLYVYQNGDLKELDSGSFRKIPFDYNNVWTTVMEWSREKKIRKKGDTIVIPEEEWEKLDPKDRPYAQRIIEEQCLLKNKQNKVFKKLSELEAYARQKKNKEKALADKQAQFKEEAANKFQNRRPTIEEDNNENTD